jgi:hypothetical protein
MKTKFRKIISRSRLSLYDPISDDFFLTSRFTCSDGRKNEKGKKKFEAQKRKNDSPANKGKKEKNWKNLK